MTSYQEAMLQVLESVREAFLTFASGEVTTLLMIGGAIGGSFVLAFVRNRLSKAIVRALGGAFAVLALWFVARLLTLALGL